MVLGKNPSTEKNSPDPKPNSIPNLTLTVLLTPHGELFSGGFFFLTPLIVNISYYYKRVLLIEIMRSYSSRSKFIISQLN